MMVSTMEMNLIYYIYEAVFCDLEEFYNAAAGGKLPGQPNSYRTTFLTF